MSFSFFSELLVEKVLYIIYNSQGFCVFLLGCDTGSSCVAQTGIYCVVLFGQLTANLLSVSAAQAQRLQV